MDVKPVPGKTFCHFIGSSSEGTYDGTDVRWDRVVVKLVVYTEKYIWGLAVEYSDGERETFGCTGSPRSFRHELDLPIGSRITRALLYGNGWGTRSGGVEITYKLPRQDEAKHFKAMSQNSGDPWPARVGAGVLLGVAVREHEPKGKSEDGLYTLGLLFPDERRFEKFYMKLGTPDQDVVIETKVKHRGEVGPITYPTRVEETEKVTRSKTVSTSSTHAWFKHHEFGVKTNVSYQAGPEASRFKVEMETNYGYKWGDDHSSTEMNSTTETTERAWLVGVGASGGSIPRGKVYHRVLLVHERVGRIYYTGDYVVELVDGARIVVPDQGTVDVQSDTKIEVKELPDDTCGDSLDPDSCEASPKADTTKQPEKKKKSWLW